MVGPIRGDPEPELDQCLRKLQELKLQQIGTVRAKRSKRRKERKMKPIFAILFSAIIASVAGLTCFNQPRDNIWVTLANQTNQTSLCLSLGGVTNPFQTCLVGLPVWSPSEFCILINNQSLCNNLTLVNPEGSVANVDGCRQCQVILSLNTT